MWCGRLQKTFFKHAPGRCWLMKVKVMITLNDYLYSGDTVLKILQKYTEDLRKGSEKEP